VCEYGQREMVSAGAEIRDRGILDRLQGFFHRRDDVRGAEAG